MTFVWSINGLNLKGNILVLAYLLSISFTLIFLLRAKWHLKGRLRAVMLIYLLIWVKKMTAVFFLKNYSGLSLDSTMNRLSFFSIFVSNWNKRENKISKNKCKRNCHNCHYLYAQALIWTITSYLHTNTILGFRFITTIKSHFHVTLVTLVFNNHLCSKITILAFTFHPPAKKFNCELHF